jgi:hypothetical protein
MNVTSKYFLEQLTENSVNVLIIKTITLEDKEYELERTRTCYGNSEIGRQQVTDQLPEQYAKAIFDIWGDEPTLIDPEPPVVSE